jgi:hypothetical protein
MQIHRAVILTFYMILEHEGLKNLNMSCKAINAKRLMQYQPLFYSPIVFELMIISDLAPRFSNM